MQPDLQPGDKDWQIFDSVPNGEGWPQFPDFPPVPDPIPPGITP